MIKLVKYDLKSILPDFFGFYLALLGLSALFPLFIELSSIDFLIVLYGLALFGTFVGMVVLSYVAIFNLFNKKLFSSQGYLTLTLPIDTRRLLGSKIITSLILTSLTGVVFTLSGVLAGLSSALVFGVTWAEIMDQVRLAFAMGIFDLVGQALLAMIPIILSSALYSLSLFLCVISFTHTSYVRKNRVLIGVLVFVGISLIVNSLVVNLFDFELMVGPGRGPMMRGVQSLDIDWWIVLGQSLFYGLLALGFFELNRYLIDHKLEIE